jgi:hypothetical protein
MINEIDLSLMSIILFAASLVLMLLDTGLD